MPTKGRPPPPLKNASFFLNIKKNAWNVLKQKNMQLYFVTFFRVSVKKLKTFQIFSEDIKLFVVYFTLEPFFFLQNHPFQAFLV